MDDLDMATELECRDREEALCRAHQSMLQCGPEYINGVACCRECGEPIPKKRLEALPGVALCVSCQEEREARQR
ncbi:MAG: TraR/DksA family transcriptional regulator, partial [Desulfovibrionaceae bacterium]|nr:TraR/DksA family transcriptional regulator [Desulfovibrionaceae bacterium]